MYFCQDILKVASSFLQIELKGQTDQSCLAAEFETQKRELGAQKYKTYSKGPALILHSHWKKICH